MFWHPGEVVREGQNLTSPIPQTNLNQSLFLEHSLLINNNISSGSFCPSPLPPNPGQPCSLPGGLECHYESFINFHGGVPGTCCCGQCDFDMICARDPTTGAGIWQPMHSMLCPLEGCGDEGEYYSLLTEWAAVAFFIFLLTLRCGHVATSPKDLPKKLVKNRTSPS